MHIEWNDLSKAVDKRSELLKQSYQMLFYASHSYERMAATIFLDAKKTLKVNHDLIESEMQKEMNPLSVSL